MWTLLFTAVAALSLGLAIAAFALQAEEEAGQEHR
jgi:hypothetical protein